MRLKDRHKDKPWTLTEGSPEHRADALLAEAAEANPEDAKPEDYSPEAKVWRERAAVCRDLLAEKPGPYLVKWEGETDKEFETRKKNSEASFVNFYEDAVNGLIDTVFAKNLQYKRPEDSSLTDEEWAKLEAFWDNVERRKRAPVDGTQFARTSCSTSLGMGGTPLILIDFPVRETPAIDGAEEEAQGLGPYFCFINPWALIAVEEDDDGNVIQVRYKSWRIERTEWGRRMTPIIVVLDRGGESVAEGDTLRGSYAKRRELVYEEAKKEYIEDPAATREFTPPATAPADLKAKFREIPIVELPTGPYEWFAPPVLRNVAMLNVRHYRKSSDYDVAESVSSVPINAYFGFSEEEMAAVQIGAYRRIHTTKSPEEADIKDISFSFETAQIALSTLEAIERYIAAKSKEPQSQRATGEEKSTIRMMDEKKKISRLQAWALQWLQALQAAVEWAARWMGIEEGGELGYLDEVFESLAAKPGWADFREFLLLLSTLDEAVWRLAISEAKRYDVISDTEDTEELIEELQTMVAARSEVGV